MQIAADAIDEKPNTNSTSFLDDFFFANTCIIPEYNTWKTYVKGGSTRIERGEDG
jgi:hypothetical protein